MHFKVWLFFYAPGQGICAQVPSQCPSLLQIAHTTFHVIPSCDQALDHPQDEKLSVGVDSVCRWEEVDSGSFCVVIFPLNFFVI